MKNSTILFLGSVLILAWFGAEVFTAQEICVTSCISFQGAALWEQVVAVAILPVLLLVGAFKLRSNEKELALQKGKTPADTDKKS